MIYQIEIQGKFEELLKLKFPTLEPTNKWNQTMWHIEGKPIVSLIHLSKKTKFCFFNNPDIELDKTQRWGSTVYSQNLEYSVNDSVNWDKVGKLIQNTIDDQK